MLLGALQMMRAMPKRLSHVLGEGRDEGLVALELSEVGPRCVVLV